MSLPSTWWCPPTTTWSGATSMAWASPPTTTWSGTTSMPWRSTSSPGRYAVESVTILVVTSRSFRRRGRAPGSHGHDVDELRRPDDDGAHAALGRRPHLVTSEGQLAQVVVG